MKRTSYPGFGDEADLENIKWMRNSTKQVFLSAVFFQLRKKTSEHVSWPLSFAPAILVVMQDLKTKYLKKKT